MSTKRGFEEVDSTAQHDRAPTKKRFRGANRHDAKSGNPNPYNNSKNSKHKAREGTMNWVRKRARTIERSLQKADDNLPPRAVEVLKRELESHRRAIQDSERKKERQKMISKYHMVRFFERKKAERLQKQLRKRLAQTTDDDEIAAINADIHIAEIDKLYAVYFPYLERYISLYPVAKKGEAEADGSAPGDKSGAELALRSERPPLWKAIEEAAAEGEESLERLRDRRAETTPVTTHSKRSEKSRSDKSAVVETKKSAKAPRASQRQSSHQDAKATRSRDDRGSKSTRESSKMKKEEESEDDEDAGGFFDFGSSGPS